LGWLLFLQEQIKDIIINTGVYFNEPVRQHSPKHACVAVTRKRLVLIAEVTGFVIVSI
jgi:hypothetical protein